MIRLSRKGSIKVQNRLLQPFLLPPLELIIGNEVAIIIWKRGQYSDVYRSTLINPSLLREGQKVKLIRGKTDVDCYPLEREVQQTFTESDLPTRPVRAKRKLVGIR